MANKKPIARRPKAVEDVESHAMYIADGSIDAALRFLERVEQTIKGLAIFPASGGPFKTSQCARACRDENKAGEGFPQSRRVLRGKR